LRSRGRSSRKWRNRRKLEVDTAIDTGGIKNIPFVVKQANAASSLDVMDYRA
jgi:hypothetical protein